MPLVRMLTGIEADDVSAAEGQEVQVSGELASALLRHGRAVLVRDVRAATPEDGAPAPELATARPGGEAHRRRTRTRD